MTKTVTVKWWNITVIVCAYRNEALNSAEKGKSWNVQRPGLCDCSACGFAAFEDNVASTKLRFWVQISTTGT